MEKLNERTTGQPLFLVPGAGLQAGGFQALAALLPVPAYGISWPKGGLPRERWPSSLEELAALFLAEVRVAQPEGPYSLAGHSFGATVCLEMAKQAEAAGETISLVALLDPRTLLRVDAGLGDAFRTAGILEHVALLSQTVADGTRYAALVEELSKMEPERREDELQNRLGAGVWGGLEHVRQTSGWYAALLAAAGQETEASSLASGRVVWLRAAETWLSEASASDGMAESTIRSVQVAVFQDDKEVAKRLANWGKAASAAAASAPVRVPGGHYAMLHEPHVAKTALRLCHALAEVEED